MAFDLNTFRSRVIRPARPNLFRVEVTLPGTVLTDLEFLCEASSVPGKVNGNYPIWYNGRAIQYAGDTQFAPWNVRVINEEENPTRGQFETWFELINGTYSGVRDASFATSLDYKGIATIYQETQTAEEPITAQYRVEGMFPTSLGAMELLWSKVDDYQTFEVVFALDWWVPVPFTGTSV